MINKDGKKVTTTPWQTKEWRVRRKEVISRTDSCEWCKKKFSPPKNPAVVHHLHEEEWKDYMGMGDKDVKVICKPCHMRVTRYGIEGPDDPRGKCPDCGGFKQSRFKMCFSCHTKGECHICGGPKDSKSESKGCDACSEMEPSSFAQRIDDWKEKVSKFYEEGGLCDECTEEECDGKCCSRKCCSSLKDLESFGHDDA